MKGSLTSTSEFEYNMTELSHTKILQQISYIKS